MQREHGRTSGAALSIHEIDDGRVEFGNATSRLHAMYAAVLYLFRIDPVLFRPPCPRKRKSKRTSTSQLSTQQARALILMKPFYRSAHRSTK